jgi:hypothetical protein
MLRFYFDIEFKYPDEGISETTFSVPDDGYFRNDLQRT